MEDVEQLVLALHGTSSERRRKAAASEGWTFCSGLGILLPVLSTSKNERSWFSRKERQDEP